MLWAVGMVIALVAIGLLVAKLYPSIWKDLSRQWVAPLIGIVVALTMIIVLLALGGASLGWTGFGEKKLWDWLQLLSTLAIPVVIALGTLWFTARQNEQQQIIENRRAQAEQELEEQRAQDDALRAYLDQMGQLVLKKDLRGSDSDSEARLLVRARTLTVLQRLDNPRRKEEVLRFLQESELVQRVDGKDPVISLLDAKLQGVRFSNATLHGANLYGADLSRAHLLESDLSMANLSRADLSHADLSGTDLSGAFLAEAILSDANLSDANLNYTYFLGADLSHADLSGASGVTKEQLELQAYSTEGAIMPSLTRGTVLPALGEISEGEYDSDEFKHALSFKVDKGWKVVWPENPERLGIETGPEGAELSFHSPSYVFDSSDPGKRRLVPAPETIDKWVSWLQRHPSLVTAKPDRARVRDETGVQIDVSATSMPARCPGGDPCLPLYRSGPGEVRADNDRFVIVDVGGEPVVIVVYAPPDKLEEFRTKAEKVLNTVNWKGT